MSDATKIQWCHSTVNPVMGCGGCELFPPPGEVLASIDRALGGHGDWPNGKSRAIYRDLVRSASGRAPKHSGAHSTALSTTNLWHFRGEFLDRVKCAIGAAAARSAEAEIGRAITCYAAKLHLNKAHSLTSPTRGANPGYASFFEKVTRFEGRVWQMARKRDLVGENDPDKPWLDGCRRLIFVSDMGDAFSRASDFGFLEEEVIAPILSPDGQRHFWLWLTKRPERMARFGERIGGFPSNVCAMTTVTGAEKLHRVDELRRVPAAVRGLSVEPLWDRIPAETLDLTGIDWLIVGGESGRYDAVRTFDLSWARELRDLCRKKRVAFFLKQLGRRPFEGEEELRLRDKHGGDWSEWPEDLRVREMLEAFKVPLRQAFL